MGKGIAVIFLGLVLAGCQAFGPDSEPPEVEDIGAPSDQQRVAREVPFSVEEYAKLEKTGTATVTGRLFLEGGDGEIIPGADETVSIAPATAYSAEAAEVALAGEAIEPADPRAQEYTHYATTDARGYFKVNGLPAGVFYIAGSVKPPGPNAQRRILINQIDLSEGETLEVSLSR